MRSGSPPEVMLMAGKCPDRGRHRNQRGFTVLEVLVTVVLIGLLMGIAAQATLFAVDNARLTRTVGAIRTLSNAVTSFGADHGYIPSGYRTVASMASLLAPYLGSVPTTDAWGNPIYYESLTVAG
ncbi:MAG TPA: prepilin-type N-terminal cleavage/methylation domain-containing protein, partial [Acidobacteria bacterium]|nr:prepilin-type N-terminal cleavage/methylation domain-containing protein [Acidobacteriota bacterium]